MKENVPLVMLVDDEPVICNVIERILQMNGYKVIVANDRVTALEHARQYKPDLVVLDIGLSMDDRRELSAQIRNSADCRIIYFTSINNRTISEKERKIYGEVDALVTRPTSIKKMLSVVGNILESHQHAVELQV